jgi:hypothetical protein
MFSRGKAGYQTARLSFAIYMNLQYFTVLATENRQQSKNTTRILAAMSNTSGVRVFLFTPMPPNFVFAVT